MGAGRLGRQSPNGGRVCDGRTGAEPFTWQEFHPGLNIAFNASIGLALMVDELCAGP